MSRLLIKQRVFSWTDTYDVYDEYGNPKYFVKADFFTIGHRIRVYDKMSGQEIGMIQERVFSFLNKFEIFINGVSYGLIQEEFSFFKPKYRVEYNGWRVQGDFWEWNYDVYSGYNMVMHINKEWFHWGDTYVINFVNPMDELAGLMLVIAIDAANCNRNNRNNNM